MKFDQVKQARLTSLKAAKKKWDKYMRHYSYWKEDAKAVDIKEQSGEIPQEEEPSLDEKIMRLENLLLYPLFFIKNYHFCIGAMLVCTLFNFIFAKLVLPQIADIHVERQHMKTQVELIMFVNYFVYLGILWYCAYKFIN